MGKRAFDFELAEQGFADNCSAGLDRTVVSERCHDGTKKAAAGRVNNTDKSEMKLGKTCMAGLQSCGPGRVRNAESQKNIPVRGAPSAQAAARADQYLLRPGLLISTSLQCPVQVVRPYLSGRVYGRQHSASGHVTI